MDHTSWYRADNDQSARRLRGRWNCPLCQAAGKLLVAILLLAALAHCPLAHGDEFLLRSGGRIAGAVVRPATPDSSHYVIALAHGGQVTLDRSEVREWRRAHPRQKEYETRAAATPHTAAAQWELAEWCRELGMSDARRTHLLLVLKLDSNHVAARHALGYTQVRGQWLKPGEYQQRAGYQRHRGRWRSAQEMQLIAEREASAKANRHWRQQLRRWRDDLAGQRPENAQLAYERLFAIDDPHAIDPLTQLLLAERLRPLKLLFTRALARIPHDRAVHQLMYVSLTDPDIEVFHESLHQIADRRLPDTVPIYIQALANVDNARVNRAAIALRKLDDPNAIGPLIEALITRHTVMLRPGRGNGTSSTFVRPQNKAAADAIDANPLQGSSFQTNEAPQTARMSVPNHEVLAALVELSGVSFGFDQPAWRRWHAAQRQQIPSFTARRDSQ